MSLASIANKCMPRRAVHALRRGYRTCSPDARRNAKYIKKNLRMKREGSLPIKVGFVVQMPEVWDKQAALFERMLGDDRFDPYILVAPAYDFVNKKVMEEANPEAAWYREKYADASDRVIDYPADAFFPDYNKEAGFEYIFYDRPYDHYLPEGLQTGAVMQAAKIAMINYCTTDWEMDDFEYYLFGRHVTMWFASNRVEAANFRKGYLQKSWRKAYDIGYPAFEYYRDLAGGTDNGKSDASAAVSADSTEQEPVAGITRFLWTPRWSTAEDNMGATSFFTYLEQLIAYFSVHPEVKLTVRPHPLMFDNFLAKGLMTEAEISELKARCAAANIDFDQNRMILDTFRETDVLITDYSSIISLFLVTGKPIVYCPTDVELTADFERLLSGMYVAESWDSLKRYLNAMREGDDPLFDIRNRIVQKELLSKKNATGRIMEILVRSRR